MKAILWLSLLSTAISTAAMAAPRSRVAPSFRLPGMASEVVSDSLRGSVVLVDFWASWCVPCRKSFPWMSGVYRRHSADGLRVIAINLDKSPESASDFLAENPAPFTIAFDPDGKTAEAFKVSGMPTSFLVGRDGTILESHIGFDPKKADAFEARIAEACKK